MQANKYLLRSITHIWYWRQCQPALSEVHSVTSIKNIKPERLKFVIVPVPDTDYELVRLISVTREAINKIRQKELNVIGIHDRRSAILVAIDGLGEQATPNAIASLLLRKRHTISNVLTKMEHDGIIKKIYDLKKKNMVRAVFTDKGFSLMNRTNTRESINSVLESLSKYEQKELYAILFKLRNGLLTNNMRQRQEQLFNTTDELFNLYLLFTETSDLLRAARRKELDEYKIRPARSAFLLSIQSLGDRATPSTLARQLIREPHSVSEMLRKMEGEGIISRKVNPIKKSSVIMSLTEKGQQIYGKLLLGLSHRKAMVLITGEERQKLKSYMEKLLNTSIQIINK
jgi:DNA-binding MarR family transcriptional regulator